MRDILTNVMVAKSRVLINIMPLICKVSGSTASENFNTRMLSFKSRSKDNRYGRSTSGKTSVAMTAISRLVAMARLPLTSSIAP